MRNFVKKILILSSIVFVTPVFASDVVTIKNVGMEMARDLASEAIVACRKAGYSVSAVVVDRQAIVRAALRDDRAPRFSLDIAEQKANASVMGGVSSGDFAKNRQDIRMEMDNVDGILLLRGGVLIETGGTRIGALGVSGAPGGDKDEACAKAALKKYNDRLQFAD
jgi:uncharacterized protein GlcG (DUF336 family)